MSHGPVLWNNRVATQYVPSHLGSVVLIVHVLCEQDDFVLHARVGESPLQLKFSFERHDEALIVQSLGTLQLCVELCVHAQRAALHFFWSWIYDRIIEKGCQVLHNILTLHVTEITAPAVLQSIVVVVDLSGADFEDFSAQADIGAPIVQDVLEPEWKLACLGRVVNIFKDSHGVGWTAGSGRFLGSVTRTSLWRHLYEPLHLKNMQMSNSGYTIHHPR